MKKVSLFIVCCYFNLSLFSQIPFESYDSWEQVVEQAQKEKKRIFVQVEAVECDECNEVASKGQNSLEIKEKYVANFVCTRINASDMWFKEFSDKYDLLRLIKPVGVLRLNWKLSWKK